MYVYKICILALPPLSSCLLRYSSHLTNGILLTWYNQEIAQWSPDPFPCVRVGSGHETSQLAASNKYSKRS